jgi:hypothetical protein
LESEPQDCGCRGPCKFRRIHYGLAKNACSQCSKSRTDTHKIKCRLLFQDLQTGLAASPILWRYSLRQQKTHEVFGCLQLLVFNPKLGLSTAVKCNPVFRACVNDPLSIHIPDNWSWQCNTMLRSTDSGSPSPFSSTYQPPHCP